MRILRSSLLWASQNTRMERLVRSSRLMRPLVSRFMPGEDLDATMAAVHALQAERTPSILTYLGENVSTDAAAAQTVAAYNDLFEALRTSGGEAFTAHVSIKLTQLGWDVDQGRTLERVDALARAAATIDAILAIDMEGSNYVDSTVDAYATLRATHSNVALCLQAYLHRTPADLQRLLPLRPYIRLVKGAYREPGNVALQTRSDIDARYRALARELLGSIPQGARAAFGTHDLGIVEHIRTDARVLGVPETNFEIQMLYGIQDAGRRQLASQGMRTRVLISYGKAWYPWFMRRLAEKPSNLLMVARNLVS